MRDDERSHEMRVTMQAVVARRFGGPHVLEVVDVPVPEPGAGQVRIRVAAAAVNPADVSLRDGRMASAGLLSSSSAVPLGWDVAGHIDAVGPMAGQFAVGDAVVGLRDVISAAGTHADHVVLDEHAVGRAPKTVSLEVAATLPLNGLTADQSLRHAAVRPGGSLLVTGAGGGVGGFVLQLAAMRGITTVALTRPRDAERARGLGALHVVTSDDGLADAVRSAVPGGVDAVIDAAVLGIDAHGALRTGGTFVSLVRPFAPPPLRGTSVVVHEVHADGARLTELAALVDYGLLTLGPVDVMPFPDAPRAHAALERGGLRGRVVLAPATRTRT